MKNQSITNRHGHVHEEALPVQAREAMEQIQDYRNCNLFPMIIRQGKIYQWKMMERKHGQFGSEVIASGYAPYKAKALEEIHYCLLDIEFDEIPA